VSYEALVLRAVLVLVLRAVLVLHAALVPRSGTGPYRPTGRPDQAGPCGSYPFW
jgi:hypothetical protein